MGWAVGYDTTWRRDIGYGVPAQCDKPACTTVIDRGLGHVCGGEPFGGEDGCGLYFCPSHGGGGSACHHTFTEEPGYEPSADLALWKDHKRTDESWAHWRAEHPDLAAALEADYQQRLEAGRQRAATVANSHAPGSTVGEGFEQAWAEFYAHHPEVLASWAHQNGRWPEQHQRTDTLSGA